MKIFSLVQNIAIVAAISISSSAFAATGIKHYTGSFNHTAPKPALHAMDANVTIVNNSGLPLFISTPDDPSFHPSVSPDRPYNVYEVDAPGDIANLNITAPNGSEVELDGLYNNAVIAVTADDYGNIHAGITYFKK